MSKTTFLERFDKTQKFFDNVYHHHKATYKGMAEYFDNYAEIEKSYSNMLFKHAQSFNSSIVDFAKEQPYVQQGVKEVGMNIEKISQLHYNFGERLKQISQYCRGEYSESKKQKQKFMKLMIEKNQQDYQKVKQTRDRGRLNEKQQQICKSLYDALDRYMEDQLLRTQKLKEQVVIYFSLSKKIAQKKIELSAAYSLKMAQFEVNISVPKMEEIEDMLVDQYNGYGGDKIYRKNREINQQIQVHRQSLRQSIIHRQKMLKIEDGMSRMTKIVDKYKSVPEQLNYPSQEDYLIGIFDRRVLPQYKQFSREFKSEVVKEFALAWISSYYNTSDNNDENMSLLTVVKTNMRVKQVKLNRAKSAKQFITKYLEKCEQSSKKTIYFLIQVSQIYEGTLRIVELENSLRQKQVPKIATYDHLLHWKIYLVLVDCLLQSLIIARQGFSILYDEYVDIFKLIHTFAKETFNLDTAIVMSLFLRKLQKVLEVTQSPDPQKIEEIFEQKISFDDEMSYTQELKIQMGHKLINFLTEQLSNFYKSKISFSNLVKVSLMVEKTLPKNYFTAMEHMHSCIRTAGFNFFEESDQEKKLIQGTWRGDQRLKNLTQVLEQLQFEEIHKNYLEPMARELSKLLGVGYDVIANKMKKQFSTPIFEIIQCNLQILCEQEGHDLQGYALRLGVCLSLLDMQQPQDINFYNMYFNVLSHYLTTTEKQYDQLLEHARKTQLWIVQDNSQATQNCIDFCSMLYKPFEFLLMALKKLQSQRNQTEFTKRFSEFIKLKLNKALKAQIQKYVTFLSDSLSKFSSKQPELNLKYKRLPAPILAASEELAKERYNYRQVSRRLFNLLFLKDQLDEIICDFIQPEIYKQINSSIFNLDLLMKVASTHPTHREILQNIYQIASLISETYNRLIIKVADVTVFHFMRRIFSNLYFQEEKGFFASDKDYKLSEFTFVKCQQELEELFLTIGRNLPAETVEQFSKQFSIDFCKAYRCEILDSNKFKIPIKQQTILTYLQSDLNFFCSTLKQKLMLSNYVKEFIEQPCKKMFRDIEKSSQKLMESFSEATMKNMNDEAKYILLILNLKQEEKAEEFVQKYKKVLK